MVDPFSTALGAALTALFVGLVNRWFNKDKEALEQGRAIRDELRQEIARLREELKGHASRIERVEAELEERDRALDEWKAKYFDLLHHHRLLQFSYERLRQFTRAMCRQYRVEPPPGLLDDDERKEDET
jgi:septal ring factor EnvC (AmiA/AmiB activator)